MPIQKRVETQISAPSYDYKKKKKKKENGVTGLTRMTQ